MAGFRGQYMDMVHPSSDVHVTDKPNHAGNQPIKEPAPTAPPAPEEEIVADIPDKIMTETETTGNPETETYESPFLPNIEVEKRPLGVKNDENDIREAFDINKFIDLSQPKLPADDSGQGELEPELPAGGEIYASTALTGAMTAPESKTSEPASPFAHASNGNVATPAKKPFPIWGWLLVFVLLAAAGAATGALIYLSGWLG
jgi:hypothetical protein